MHDSCKHAKFQWWLKSSGLCWRLIATKRGSCWGAFCSAELLLEAGEPLPRLSPSVSPGGTGQHPLRLPGALGEFTCQKPNPQPGGTLTSWRTRPPGIGCCMHHQGLHLEPSNPRMGMDRVSSSPAQMGITLGRGCWAHALCAHLKINKPQPTDLQKSSCVWNGVSRYPLCSVLGRLHLDPAPYFGPLVWEGQENEPGSVRWAGGTEAAAFGQQRESRGAPAAAVGR